MTYRARKRHRRHENKRGKLLLSFGVISSFLVIAVLSFGLYVLSVAAETPDIDELKPEDKGSTSFIYAADGSKLGAVQSDEARIPVPLKRMSPSLQQATIAIEDADFYEHGGVDPSAIFRAAIKNFTEGEVVQGGSTITQQLVKNLYTSDPERDFEAKIREAKLAEQVEDKLTKDEILERYLNTAAYGTIKGRPLIGVEAASQSFFSVAAKNLSVTQAATLAGLPQAPTSYNPLISPEGAKTRRNEVLLAMEREGYISSGEARNALQKPLGLKTSGKFSNIKEDVVFNFVTSQLIDEYGADTVREGGLEIHTSIDPRLQEAGRKAIAANLNLPDDPASAIVTVDPENGHILAMVSSARFENDQLNIAAQAQRQPGSSFKTFVLAAAIRAGINPATTSYVSKPLNLNLPEYGPWEVSTYSNTYGGSMNLIQATLTSDNTVYAQLDLDVGPKNVTDMAYDLGITSELQSLPAESIGGVAFCCTPLEMANSYATLASGGVRHEPTAITKVIFPDGKVDNLGSDTPTNEAMTDGQAYEVTKILRSNVTGGTGGNASLGACQAAGKTGTTDDFKDAWFVGYTPDKATSVWVGYPDEQREMRGVHGIDVAGGTIPASIWGDYMAVARGDECNAFPLPSTPPVFKPFFGQYATDASEYQSTISPTEEVAPEEEDPAEDDSPSGAVGDPGAYAPGIQEPSGNGGGGGGGNGGGGGGNPNGGGIGDRP